MLEKYELFVERSTGEQIKRLRGKRRKAFFDFFDLLSTDPFINGGIHFEDHKGRLLQKVTVLGLVITFHVDHALREIKILTVRLID